MSTSLFSLAAIQNWPMNLKFGFGTSGPLGLQDESGISSRLQ